MKIKTITEIVIIWTNRKQNLKECTESLIIFLERLKRLDTRLGIWYEQSYSRKGGMENRVYLEYDNIKRLLCKKCANEEYPEFTFLTGFWNGAATDALSYGINFSLGGDNPVGTNNCSLTFPWEGQIYEHYRIRENWEKLLELFIDHWQPDQYRDFNDNLVDLL